MSARNVMLVGDARQRLAEIPAASVDCVITSPPYVGSLRDYGHPEQLGQEPTVSEWVANLRVVVREIARVLSPTGSMWINVGDRYSSDRRLGTDPRGLLLAPERLAVALSADGWLIRNRAIWAKTNPKPEAVRNRLSSTAEIVFFATRRPDAFFDLDSIREPYRSEPGRWAAPTRRTAGAASIGAHPLGKNPGDVWHVGTSSFRGAHSATFPRELVRRPLLATCPERVCSTCGIPWKRRGARQLGHLALLGSLKPGCGCTAPPRPGLVLDPFMGSGTVALAAIEHGRDWIGIELNSAYAAIAKSRIAEARLGHRAA